MNKLKIGFIFLVFALLALVITACQPAAAQNPTQTAPSSTQKAAVSPTPTVKYMGQFSVNPSHAPIGATVNATGSGFAANTDLELDLARFQW